MEHLANTTSFINREEEKEERKKKRDYSNNDADINSVDIKSKSDEKHKDFSSDSKRQEKKSQSEGTFKEFIYTENKNEDQSSDSNVSSFEIFGNDDFDEDKRENGHDKISRSSGSKSPSKKFIEEGVNVYIGSENSSEENRDSMIREGEYNADETRNGLLHKEEEKLYDQIWKRKSSNSSKSCSEEDEGDEEDDKDEEDKEGEEDNQFKQSESEESDKGILIVTPGLAKKENSKKKK
jgi:hypothetical protein